MEELVEKYFQGLLSVEEKVDLLRRCETDMQLKQIFVRRQNLQALMEMYPKPEDDADIQTESPFPNRTKQARQFPLWRMLRLTAAAACLICCGYFAGHYFTGHIGQQEAQQYNTLFVPAGQRVSFTLEDGTLVWLNAQSRLTYPTSFAKDARRVQIEGEAWFEVTKNPDKPFIVSMNDFEVEVLGTTFNIYNYPWEPSATISLIEGKVSVYRKDVPDERTEMNPDDEVIVVNGKLNAGKIQDKSRFLWKDGLYCFENERLDNILKKLEIYYDIKFEVKNASMLDWRYTVKFRQRDGIDEIMRLMQHIHNFKMIKDDYKNLITLSR
jgi:ferric-dicitrate binding protein FerR (iron transport regulator)